MNEKNRKPGYEKIVCEFDIWLKANKIRLMREKGITVIKEISRQFNDLKLEYINSMLHKYKSSKKNLTNIIKEKGEK